MRRWLNHAATENPNFAAPDTKTITMDWVLEFPRAKRAYNELMENRMYATTNARELILKRLQDNGYLQKFAPKTFCPCVASMPLFDTFYVQQATVTIDAIYARGTMNVSDDSIGALGSFNLRMVIMADIQAPVKNPITGRFSHLPLAVTDVGVYVRDVFDFEGDQPLGYWDDESDSFSVLNGTGQAALAKELTYRTGLVDWPSEYVSNATMRAFRRMTGRGGDFLIFSDVKWTKLTTPDIVSIPINNLMG